MSIANDLMKFSSVHPDKIALFDDNGRTVSYHQLLNYVLRMQFWLELKGLKPGDAIMGLLPNTIETAIIFLASLRGGFIYAPLPCTATLAEVYRWKELCKTSLCLITNALNLSLQNHLLEMSWQVETIDIDNNLTWLPEKISTHNNCGHLIIPSSGSTGEPKAIVLDGDRLWSAAGAFLNYHQVGKADIRFWNYLPMSYLGGLFNLLIIPLVAGGSILIDDIFNGKTFLTFWSTVERFKINSLWLVPTIIRGLLTLANRIGQKINYPKIELCYLGTAPISLEEKQRFSQLFGIVPLENYGLSETTFISSEIKDEIAFRHQGSVGKVMPNVQVKLIPHDDNTLNEIWIKTPFLMEGYLDKGGEIRPPALDSEGYFKTGDFGKLINGQVILSGRQRDIIKKGGVLIALREIEVIAESYAGIAESAAVKTDHDFYGESYLLYIRTKEPIQKHEIYIGEFTAWLHGQLMRNKWPERIVYCCEFPKTASGKIQKHLLKNGGIVHV